MLIPDNHIPDLVDRYLEFYSSLTWFRMYCIGRMGNDKSDYIKGFETIKSDFEYLYEFDSESRILNWKEKLGTKLILDLEAIIKAKRFTDAHIDQISEIIWEFQNENERNFRSAFLDKEIEIDATLDYPDELFKVVDGLLKSGANEEAVLQAFKFLDSHIQKLLSVPPHELYGEDLVNYAFSPSSGVLQLGTDPNEQKGLRNFFSGANALFRNPSAHRFMEYSDFDAGALVAMVTMMASLVSMLANKNLKQGKIDTSPTQE